MRSTTITQDTLANAIRVMRGHMPLRFHMNPPTTTKALGISGQVLKQHLGCGSWAEVYQRFVEGNDEIPALDDRKTLGHLPKRLNPETGEFFKKGEKSSDGEYFMHYKLKEPHPHYSGYAREYWTSWEQFKHKQIEDVFSKSKTAASKRRDGEGVEWNISKEKQAELIEIVHCPVCSVRMRMPWEDFPRAKRTPIKASFSIDRLDNEVGYIDSNVNAICHGCNTMKGTMSKEQIIEAAQRLAAFVS